MNLSLFTNFYLVGIKGVAMTSLAQMLIDAGKQVRGSDVAEEFVTQSHLDTLKIKIDSSFRTPIPNGVDCVVYTGAHQGTNNPQVISAQQQAIPVISQAEAVAWFANQKRLIAVCGVGGKSTTSAMLVWILTKLKLAPSFSVGVGDIVGLERTGQWNQNSELFVIEADEYVINPTAAQNGSTPIPRFSFLKPDIIICSNLVHDHPDVYPTFTETKQAYNSFFAQLSPDGLLISSTQDSTTISHLPAVQTRQFQHLEFGPAYLEDFQAHQGITTSRITLDGNTYQLQLQVPGIYNVFNAMAAILACIKLGVDPQEAIDALASFQSTKRRFESKGIKNGVTYYDDYAHHPQELKAVITALTEWFPEQHKIIAFQPHTYSRTKELFDEFVAAFAQAEEVILLDIFASAREAYDPTISSVILADAIRSQYNIPVHLLSSYKELAVFCQKLDPDTVVLTVGAGDIYQAHELI